VTQPAFRTARLLVRPRIRADVEACIAMNLEPGVTAHVDGPWDDPVAHRTFVEASADRAWPPSMGYWVVEEDGAFAGWVLLIPEDGAGPEIEIGWRLRPRCWGRGIATEAARPVLRHGFDAIGLDSVVAEIRAANAASLRVAAKLGLAAADAPRHGASYRRCVMTRADWNLREGGRDAPAC
jgi:RimJ/RimL family protein N-acetyltransferase